MENVIGIREYDVPYYVRVMIDQKIRCGYWYRVKTDGGILEVEKDQRQVRSAICALHAVRTRHSNRTICKFVFTSQVFGEPHTLAFDIETTKPPLKFPDSSMDEIMMISYMVDGRGYLITNRAIVAEDVRTPCCLQCGLYGLHINVAGLMVPILRLSYACAPHPGPCCRLRTLSTHRSPSTLASLQSSMRPTRRRCLYVSSTKLGGLSR
jgi:DNA polymerase family B